MTFISERPIAIALASVHSQQRSKQIPPSLSLSRSQATNLTLRRAITSATLICNGRLCNRAAFAFAFAVAEAEAEAEVKVKVEVKAEAEVEVEVKVETSQLPFQLTDGNG